MESEGEVPLHSPLNGWTYLRAYYDDDDEIVLRNKLVTDGLEKYALVELSALAGQSRKYPRRQFSPRHRLRPPKNVSILEAIC